MAELAPYAAEAGTARQRPDAGESVTLLIRAHRALGQYQREHNLEVTSAIDEPTVQSLGLTTEQA